MMSETPSDRYVVVGPVKPDADGNVEDVCMQITSRFSGRCANCGKPYLEGALIGHSDEAGGWVGSCCVGRAALTAETPEPLRQEGVTAESACPSEDGHRFAAYSGYCVECGADGWTPEERKRVHAARSAVRRG